MDALSRPIDPQRVQQSPTAVLSLRGGLRVFDATGEQRIDLRYGATRRLLAILILLPGRGIPRTELLEWLFGDKERSASLVALRQLVADLRRACAQHAALQALNITREALWWLPPPGIFDEIEWARCHPDCRDWPAWLDPLVHDCTPWLAGETFPGCAALATLVQQVRQRLAAMPPRPGGPDSQGGLQRWSVCWHVDLFGSTPTSAAVPQAWAAVQALIARAGANLVERDAQSMTVAFARAADIAPQCRLAWQLLLQVITELPAGIRWAAAIHAHDGDHHPDQTFVSIVQRLAMRARGNGIIATSAASGACPLAHALEPLGDEDLRWLPEEVCARTAAPAPNFTPPRAKQTHHSGGGLPLPESRPAVSAHAGDVATQSAGSAAYWIQAARAATAAGNHAHALEAYGRLAAIGYPEGEPGIWLRAAHVRAACAVYGYTAPEVVALAAQVQLSDAALQSYPAAGYSLLALQHVVAIARGQRAAMPILEHMLTLAVDDAQRFHALGLRACAGLLTGQWPQAMVDMREAMGLASRLTLAQRRRYFPSDLAVFLTAQLTWMQWLTGDAAWHDTQQQLRERMADLQTSVDDRLVGACYLSHLYRAQGQTDLQYDEALRATASPSVTQSFLWRDLAALLAADALAQRGRGVNIAQLRDCAMAVARADRGYAVPAFIVAASAMLHAGEPLPALDFLAQAALAGAADHADLMPEAQRLRARALYLLGHTEDAQSVRADALARARSLGAWGWLRRWA